MIWCFGVERGGIVRFGSISKNFCNYSIGNVLHGWSPFFNGVVFFVCPCILSFFLNESCFHLKKIKNLFCVNICIL